MNLVKAPLFLENTLNLEAKQAQFSYADMLEWENETLTASFLESKENIVLVQCQKEAEYNIHIVCKAGTKNTFFFHSCVYTQQKISLCFTLEDKAEVFLVSHFHNQNSAELSFQGKSILGKNARFSLVQILMNQGQIETLFQSENGENSITDIASLLLSKDSGKTDMIIENHCKSYNSHGKIRMRSILSGDSQYRMQGLPLIGKEAKNSSAHLEQKTLLLSKKARVHAIPLLSVSHNQVQASHASSVATFSPEDIFYLMSRGIDPLEAKKLIIEGFSTELLEMIPSENIQQCLKDNVKEY